MSARPDLLRACARYHWAQAFLAMSQGKYTAMHSHAMTAQHYDIAADYPDRIVVWPRLKRDKIDVGETITQEDADKARQAVAQKIHGWRRQQCSNES